MKTAKMLLASFVAFSLATTLYANKKEGDVYRNINKDTPSYLANVQEDETDDVVFVQNPVNSANEESRLIEIEAVGVGVAPDESCSPAQAVAMAKRAAMIDAYKQLGEQMYGIKINSTDNVRNMVLKSSIVKTKVNAMIRGAKVVESSCAQGICQVSMELKLDSRIWNQVFGI